MKLQHRLIPKKGNGKLFHKYWKISKETPENLNSKFPQHSVLKTGCFSYFRKGGRTMETKNPCPYPGTCEFDDFRRSGNHLCMRVVCPYALHLGALIREHKRYAESLKPPGGSTQARESG